MMMLELAAGAKCPPMSEQPGEVWVKDGYSPERLADRAEIADVMHRWCRAIDRRDYEAMREVFHADATDSHGPGHYDGDIAGLIEWIRGRHETIPFCLHALNNMFIEFTGLDEAVVETSVTAIQHYPPEGDPVVRLKRNGNPDAAIDMIALGRYADHFQRRDGDWRIFRRVVIMDSQMLVEVSGGTMASGVTLGRRDKDDFIYELRSRLGL